MIRRLRRPLSRFPLYNRCISSFSDETVIQNTAEELQRQGYSVYPHALLSKATCRCLHGRIPELFAGNFETGIYPDEWHWRQGISKEEGVTREMCNAWKSDRLVASIILHESLGELVCNVMGWPSARIAQDDVVWKPPSLLGLETNTVVGFHQDSAYISSQFEPYENNSVTVWMALDDTDEETGCVQYVAGSHLWTDGTTYAGDKTMSSNTTEASFHGATAESYQESLPQDAHVVSVPVSQGYAILHHQDVWHGSGPNRSTARHRRALVGHYLRGDVHFKQDDQESDQTPWGRTSYIYGRYKRYQSIEIDESFFPIVYASPAQEQVRTAWLDKYIEDV